MTNAELVDRQECLSYKIMANSANIDHLRIATPCPISWEQMTGDNRVRFCDHCHLNVYNISELSRMEAETLIASTEGRLCARLFRRADGAVLTKDCPVGLRALRRRVATRSAAIFAALVSLAGLAFGQKDGKTACTPQTKITRTNATSNPDEKVLSGTVVDPNGAVIPGATVTLVNSEGSQRQITTNDAGGFEFAALAAGEYSITIELTRFKPLKIKNVVVEKNKLTSINVILQLQPSTQTVIVGVLMESSLIDVPPGTTIIDEKMIQSLPH